MANTTSAMARSTPIQFTHQIHTALDQENFLIWKSQILPVLKGYGLIGFIDGSRQAPNQFINGANGAQSVNPEYETWIQQDQLILAWILSSVSTSILAQVVNCETSATLWSKIQQIYASQSIARELELKLQLQTSKKGAKSCLQFTQHMQTLADRLRSIGSEISDHELMMYILQGLGTEFDNFVTAVTMQDTPPSLTKLNNLLLAHEARIQANLNSLSTSAVHLTDTSSQNNPSQLSQEVFYSNNNQNRGFQGGRQNNTASRGSQSFNQHNGGRNTFNRGRGGYRGCGRGRQNASPKVDSVCQICELWGHTAVNCYHRFDIRYVGSTSTSTTPPPTNHQAMIAEPTSTPTATWFLDSGATTHVTSDINNLSSAQPYNGADSVHIGNGMSLSISHKGCSSIGTSIRPIKLNNVLVVAAITKNLLSISQLIKDNQVVVEFSLNYCLIKDLETNKILLRGTLHNGLYKLDSSAKLHHQLFLVTQSTADVWHCRLAHCSSAIIDHLKKLNQISIKHSSSLAICEDCNRSKAHKLPFSSSTSFANKPLQVVHSDLWGPSPIVSSRGNRYYVSFIDEYTRFCWLYPCASKSDVSKIFPVFKSKVENLLNTKIQTLQCDGGYEYKPIMTQFPEITIQMSCPYTPEQNGLAERKHRHIVELGLANIFHAALPMKYWDTVFESVVFVINRLPSTPNCNISPYQKLFNQSPDYHFLHVIGCACYPLLRPYTSHKLEPRSEKCVFLGYSQVYKGYQCLHVPTNRIYISRHVVFDDCDLPFTDQSHSQLTESIPSTTNTPPQNILSVLPPQQTPPFLLQQTPIVPSEPSTPHLPLQQAPTQPLQPPTTATASSIPTTSNTHSMQTRTKTKNLKPKKFPNHQLHSLTHSQKSSPEPTTYNQAVKLNCWRQAMAAELDALARNSTWELVPPPPGAHIIGAKWIFKTKYNADGSVERHKARLVAKGFNQEEGIDYNETFSPVVKSTTIRIVLCIALSKSWPLHQLDVNNAFLNGELEETVYLQQPPGFTDAAYPNHVCRLKKALYGLKQAPRAWFQKLKSFLLAHQFTASTADPSLFIFSNKQVVIYLLVYVDDIIITGSSSSAISSLIDVLDKQFSIKDLGSLKYFLGIEVSHCNSALHLSQTRYITSVIERASMQNSKPCQTPMQAGLQLSKFSGTILDNPHMYRSIVGALQYATITRPDIQFAVNKASQFMAQPTETHWQLVKRILRYLKGTLTHGLTVQPSNLTLNAYCDADWAGCPDDRRSTTGFVVYLGCNLISWSSKKQNTVSRSSTETEYRSMAVTATEITWIQSLLHELGCLSSAAPTLWCDNLGATFLAANPIFHARTKHIELDFHFVREKVVNKQLNVRFICSADQLGDVFTKGLSKSRFHLLRDKLNVFPNPLSLRGAVVDQNNDQLEMSSSEELEKQDTS
ncbi:hypothetical protein LUZ61_008473 [Rhynchospora tenuis]|uniref:Integrase catalytic domain-containing protein n=1 Tax=Rhynchospora tenuis TaxID=198213 RepID=A0AAD5ZVP0_9POAL|nr:hypothetical protein LUZ61_008473 [Rhynchospora tenuis]